MSKKTKVNTKPYSKVLKSRTLGYLGSIFGNVLSLCILVLLIIGIIFSMNFKTDGKTGTDMFGTHMVIVSDASMELSSETNVKSFDIKDINRYAMVFMDTVPEDEAKMAEFYKGIKVGDVLTYTNASKVYTHRVTKVEGNVITVKGDRNKDTNVVTIDIADKKTNKKIIGKVTGQSYFLGLLVSSVNKPLGYTCIFILPCIFIAILGIMKFYKIKSEKDQDLVISSNNNNFDIIKKGVAQKKEEINNKSKKLWIG